ncbi:uncharacterized protein LOC142163758 [Nicotiana tabacum]|uniref:Uncharacterized protein LOC142163758 n=1 Tax=Nicotiana tabacum TaxID=4097 RepID=A0AC58RWA5_TOBAC
MISTIFWNIRGVRSKKAIHRLKLLININKVVFVAFFEPFVDMSKINGYKSFLGFQHYQANVNGKIWCLWNYLDQTEVLVHSEQQITLNMKENAADSGTFITAVYAKCTTSERRDLWYSIHNMNNTIDGPWCIGGDFSIIMDPTEKLGGNPHRACISLDFISTMESCGLMDIRFTGPRYTWCNNRRPSKIIWKRLDMIMINGINTSKITL